MMTRYDAVLVNGPVGVGKSTVIGALDAAESRPHAVVDLDDIRRLRPAPEGDPFNLELQLENLASLAVNFRKAGAERLVIAGVVERRQDAERYADALRTRGAFPAGLLVVRLTARPDVLEARLRRRHAADDDDAAMLDWHLARTIELSGILDRERLDDVVLDSSTATPRELADAIRAAAGWA